MTSPLPPSDHGDPPPVLDYQEPPPADRWGKVWAVVGGLLGVAWVLGGVFFAIVAAYAAQMSQRGFVALLGAEALALAGIVAVIRPRRHTRPFVAGVAAGVAVGALIDGVCFSKGF